MLKLGERGLKNLMNVFWRVAEIYTKFRSDNDFVI